MRALRLSLALCMLSACGDDEEERNAPPVGSGGGGPGGGVSGATGIGTDSAGSGGSSGPGMTTGGPGPLTGGAASTTGSVPYAVLTGRFNDGGGGYALPIQCTVRFHRPGEINPANGVESATTFSRPFVIDAFPQSFTIMSDEIGDVAMMGDPGYVSSECDIDGDNFFDDNAGAYFPGLPMTEITIPASSIDLAVGPI